MFGKKKERWKTRSAFGFTVDVTVGSDSDWIMRIMEKADALQQQNRRGYNLLFERQSLILDHLNLQYVPETEKKEPARLDEKSTVGDSFNHAFMSAVFGSGTAISPYKPKKKRGRPKKK